jgi:hypothetical protein
MKICILGCLAVALLTASISQAKHHASEPAVCTETLLESYFHTQEALAADELEAAKTAAKKLLGDVPCSVAFQPSAKAITVATSIQEARIAFKKLSDALIPVVEKEGTGVTEAHLVYCPMAFDFKGAAWLQKDTSVANPYFGAQMFACGSVKKSFGESSK